MFRYIGDSEHMAGIPARDLTDVEYEGLTTLLKDDVDDSPLYEWDADKPGDTPPGVDEADEDQEAVDNG